MPPLKGRSLFLLLLLPIGYTWLRGVFSHSLNHDEVSNMHMVWLYSQNLKPFTDFFTHHPPFLLRFLSFIGSVLPESSTVIFFYRLLAGFGAVSFLAAMIQHARKSFPSLSAVEILIVLSVVFFHPLVRDYFSEFRTDSISYALLFGAALLVRDGLPKKTLWNFLGFGFLSGVSVFMSPKLVYFPVLLSLGLVIPRKNHSTPFMIGAGIAGGALISMIWAVGTLMFMGLDLKDVFDFVVIFNSQLNAVFQPHHGLASSLLQTPFLLCLALMGGVFWCVLIFKKQAMVSPFEFSLAGFLIIQLLSVSVSFQQYTIPWLLISLVFLPSVVVFMKKQFPSAKNQVPRVLLVVYLATFLFAQATIGSNTLLSAQVRLIQWMNDVSPKDSTVVALPPLHPIFRRDAFYGWVEVRDTRGPLVHDILEKLPSRQERFSKSYRLKELEQNPPSLITLRNGPVGIFEDPEVVSALAEFLEKNHNAYHPVEMYGVTCLIRR